MRLARGNVIAAASLTGATVMWGLSIAIAGHSYAPRDLGLTSAAAATLTGIGVGILLARRMRSRDRELLREDRAALIRACAAATRPAAQTVRHLRATAPMPRIGREGPSRSRR